MSLSVSLILDSIFINYRAQEISEEKIKELHRELTTYFHQQFLNVIHPFSDGNGRIGRLITNLILLNKGYPPVFIKEVNKDEYLKRFELSDNDMNPMLDFMADRLVESLEEKWEFIKERK